MYIMGYTGDIYYTVITYDGLCVKWSDLTILVSSATKFLPAYTWFHHLYTFVLKL